MRSEKTQPKKPESRARALENKSCQAALERSMTDRVTDDWQTKTRSAPAMALYARRAAEDWQTKVRGVLADEYEIYVDCATDPTPLTYDEWLNS